MGRRRRKYKKRPLLRAPRVLPTIFECPHCGAKALTVEIRKKERNEQGLVKAVIKCGNCGLYAEMWVPELYQPVDVYSKFLDAYLEGRAEYKILKEGAGEEKTISLEELAASGEEGELVEAGEGGEGAEEEG